MSVLASCAAGDFGGQPRRVGGMPRRISRRPATYVYTGALDRLAARRGRLPPPEPVQPGRPWDPDREFTEGLYQPVAKAGDSGSTRSVEFRPATSRSPATTPSTATGRSARNAICKAASRRARCGSTSSARSGPLIRPWRCGSPPTLSADVLETYRLKAERPAGYTLDDHVQLAEGSPMRPLFEEFRKEVLALDPCVSEEILKLSVAYKAETNFVDIVAQKSRLRLSLGASQPSAISL